MAALPYLKAAVLCERVLVEKDEVISAVRIYDRLTIEIETDADAPEIPKLMATPWVLISLVRGESSESHDLGVAFVSPSGKTIGDRRYPFRFPADVAESTANIVIQLRFSVEEGGMYWMKIDVDGSSVTQVPLRVETSIDLVPKK